MAARFKVTRTYRPSTFGFDTAPSVNVTEDLAEALADLLCAIEDGTKVTFKARRPSSDES